MDHEKDVERIKNYNVILLINFNKIHESRMRFMEYYLLEELSCSCLEGWC